MPIICGPYWTRLPSSSAGWTDCTGFTLRIRNSASTFTVNACISSRSSSLWNGSRMSSARWSATLRITIRFEPAFTLRRRLTFYPMNSTKCSSASISAYTSSPITLSTPSLIHRRSPALWLTVYLLMCYHHLNPPTPSLTAKG